MRKLPLRRTSALVAAAGVTLVGLTACSTGSSTADDAAEPTANTSADAEAFPVSIDTSFGEVTIDEAPERVVALGPDSEVALSLGVAPIAIERNDWAGGDEGRTLWFDEAFAEIEGAEDPELLDTTDGTPVDEIIALEPDVVLATNSGITEDDFNELMDANIPVVGYPGVQWTTTWQQSLEMVGEALGRAELAADVTEETEQLLTDTVADHPQLEGASFLWGYFDATDLSKVGLYTSVDNRPRILEEMGMVNPPIVADGAQDVFFFDVSLERAAELDADVFIAYATSDDEAAQLVANPLVSQIPPVAAGNTLISVTPADSAGLSAPSPLALAYVMENFIPKLAAAVDGQPQT